MGRGRNAFEEIALRPGVDVSFGICRYLVAPFTERTQELQVASPQNPRLPIYEVADVQVALLRIRRERNGADSTIPIRFALIISPTFHADHAPLCLRILGDEDLFDERAVPLKDLNTIAL